MPINYNRWFYDYHKYLKGTKDGNQEYNDTKWVHIGKRYQKLIDLHSDILYNQPYMVLGNQYAFERLLELLNNSNYTFSDVNDALLKTYRMNLRNAMSRMLVNTHHVIYSCKSTERKKVYTDVKTRKYVIEVPFDQMHFGERDEFIRRRIEKMHQTSTDLYIPIEDFHKSEISDILGFTIICTTNGYISNDCDIALSEKGLRFKIGWNRVEDVEFIIYKLDKAFVRTFSNVNPSSIMEYDGIGDCRLQLTYPRIDGNLLNDYTNYRCLVNIHNTQYPTVSSVPNFGLIAPGGGVYIRNLQPKTKQIIENHGWDGVSVTIYILKYFHEVKGVYPALNYMDMVENKLVYTDHDNAVDTEHGTRVMMSSGKNRNMLEPTTPPICIDRPTHNAFDSFAKCMNLRNAMMASDRLNEINTVKAWFDIYECDPDKYADVTIALRSYYNAIKPYYQAYIKCAIITSLVEQSYVEKFTAFVKNVIGLRDITQIEQAEDYVDVDEFNGYYNTFVNELYTPFTDEQLQPFEILNNINKDYYRNADDDRFNRPVGEQSLIALHYDREEECWLFCNPDIKHFTGIGNTFYINSKLNGDEIFKFFVMYSDTESPSEQTVDDNFPMNVAMDFDKFCNEIDRHIGFIRYWYAENKLAKLCYISENKYDEETTIGMLSKILKHKIDGRDLLYEYDSDIDYEESRMTSDNLNGGEYDKRAPFAVNFLFYTLSMLQDNEDKLQAYFYQQLTHKKFNLRYADLDIRDVLFEHGSSYINPSKISVIPNDFDVSGVDKSNMITDEQYHLYYGLPYVWYRKTIQTNDYYPYTFDTYHNDDMCKLVNDECLDDKHYIQLQNPSSTGYTQIDLSTDAQLARLVTLYMTAVYDVCGYLETNYTLPFNQQSFIDKAVIKIQQCIDTIQTYADGKTFYHPESNTIVDTIVNDNPIIQMLRDIYNATYDAMSTSKSSRSIVYHSINKYLSHEESVYKNVGFKQRWLKRARRTYVHLKKLNKPMNLHQYERYWDNMDMDFIDAKTDKFISDSPIPYSKDIFAWGNKIHRDRDNDVMPGIGVLNAINVDSIKRLHMLSLQDYCITIITEDIKDTFMINTINIGDVVTPTKPMYVEITLPSDDHTTVPYQTSGYSTRIILYPVYSYGQSGYRVTGLIPSMHYAFFDDEPITVSCNIYDHTNTNIGQSNVTITFMKIGCTSDDKSEIQLLPDVCNTHVDIQNVHETMDINSDDQLINDKDHTINYELLFGNRFYPLDHTSELIRTIPTELPGSIDRTYIQNYQLNQIALHDYGKRTDACVYFKPSQIMHLTPSESVIESIGGGNFIDQRVYLKTTDGTNYIFPATVTYIDHNVGRGILEMKPVSRESKWLPLEDEPMIYRYMNNTVPCEILPDNISNFLDEFSNDAYGVYNPCKFDIDEEYDDENFSDAYSFPGDPLFVESNADYVYTRLNYMFNDMVENRFIDDEHKTYRFIYMGSQDSRFEMKYTVGSPSLQLSFLKHHFNMLTNPEMYPLLRDEPNDHSIWNKERELFDQLYREYDAKVESYVRQIAAKRSEYRQTNDFHERLRLKMEMEDLQCKMNYASERANTIHHWFKQLESPTTWFNVISYDAANTYVHNGRAPQSQSFKEDIRDIPIFEELELYIYDWEHHHWVDPSTYALDKSADPSNYYSSDNPDEFLTKYVFDKTIITLKSGFPSSKKLLIYLAYNTSKFTLMGQPEMSQQCQVQFKPILSLNHDDAPTDLFKDLKIRKVFDINEEYRFVPPLGRHDAYNAPETFSQPNAFHVIRYKRSGKNMYSPTVRLCDVNVINDHTAYKIDQFNVWVKNPFPDVTINQSYRSPQFESLTYTQMDDFVPNQHIKLICIQNKTNRQYDGSISNIMFEGVTGNSINHPITITSSSVPYLTSGTFICTVFMDPTYPCKGGIYTVTVSYTGESLIDDNQCWMRIPESVGIYKELPDEFLLQPKTMTLTGNTVIQLQSTYDKNSPNLIYGDNDGTTNLMEYMYDTIKHVRLPISDIPHNDHQKRFTINTISNPQIKTLHTTYVNVCRYSLSDIPSDGFIDVTGYVPTPLSRERYEFWVNGRFIPSDNVIIVSPTSFQLINLKSLHNFELIELVEDVTDSQLMNRGSMYIGLDGTMYSSYERVMMANTNVIGQDIRYTFNAYPNHTKLQDFTKGIITPNNKDLEIDILSGYTTSSGSTTSYTQLTKYPSINGVPLHHLISEHIGIQEIPFDDIIKIYDRVWKKEILDNELFPMTHRDSTMMSDTFNRIHVHESDKYEGMFVVHVYGLTEKYHTLYISKLEDGGIDETDQTVKIIPFVKNGTRIHIDGKYRGLWIHSTSPNYTSIQIK